MTRSVVVAVTKSIKERLEAQRVVGPKRQAKVALEMLIGATACAHAIADGPDGNENHTRDANALSLTAMLVAVRGMEAL